MVTYFLTRRFPPDDIEAVLHQPYAGQLAGGIGGNNMFSSRVQMLEFRIRGKDRVFAGTAAPNRRLRATARTIADELGVSVISLAG